MKERADQGVVALGSRAEERSERRLPVVPPLSSVFALALAASLASIVLVGVLSPTLRRGRSRFSDIIAAEHPTYFKNGDFFVLGAWFVVFLLLFGLCLWKQRVRRVGVPGALWIQRSFSDRTFAGVALVGTVLATTAFTPNAFTVVASAGCALAVLPVVLYRQRPGWAAPSDMAVTLVVAFAALLALLSTFSAVSRGSVGEQFYGRSGLVAAFTATIGLAMGVRLLASRPRLLAQVALAAQIPVPLLLLGGGTSFFSWRGSVHPAPTAGWLTALVVLIVAAGVWSAVCVLRQSWHQEAFPSELLLSTTVVAISGFLALRLTPPSSLFLGDDFHLGEALIQWPQLMDFRKSPFGSFVPIPGLIGSVYGAINAALGGTAASFGRAVVASWMLMAMVSAALMCRLVNPLRALVLAPVALAGAGIIYSDRFLFVVPSALALLLPSIRVRPFLWIASWATLATANVLLVPATGMAFTLASLPAVACQAWNVFRLISGGRGSRQYVRSKGSQWLAAILLGLVLFALPILVGALRTSLAQTRSNSLAWGLPLFAQVEGLAAGARSVGVDLVRFSGWWFGIPLALSLIVTGRVRRREEGQPGPVTLLVLTTGIFTLAITPYAFGRIDGGGPSRPGGVTLVVVGVLLPVALFMRSSGRRLTAGERGVMASMLIAPLAMQGWMGENLAQRAALVYPAGHAEFVDGRSLALPGLGSALVPAEKVRVPVGNGLRPSLSIGLTLDRLLDRRETYLDLSNSQAFYQYTDRELPTPYGAFMYAAGEQQQTEMLEYLLEDPPPVVVVSEQDFPASVLSVPYLRVYRVTRWLFASGYTPFRGEDGQLFLLRPDRRGRAGRAMLTPVLLGSLDFDLVGGVGVGDLPGAWGASFGSMAWRFTRVQSPPPIRQGAILGMHLPPWPTDRRPDFLLLDLLCDVEEPARVRVTWRDGQGVEQGIEMSAARRNLVPLGSMPSWSGSPRLTSLTVEMQAASCTAGHARIEGFYRLVK